MQNKTVILTGAGFSVPAKLPVQNQILREMTKAEPKSFLAIEPDKESRKFLCAYIKFGLFLLMNYAKSPYDCYKNEFDEIKQRYNDSQGINRFLVSMGPEFSGFNNQFYEYLSKYIFDDGKYNLELYTLREKIRNSLEKESLEVCLEDIFTSFDKSIRTKDVLQKYTYNQMDEIRHSIMRLFSYYFGRNIQKNQYNQHDYDSFIDCIKSNIGNVTLISTNWDTVAEKYLEKNKINYDLCLNNEYYIYDDSRKNKRVSKDKMNLIKLHGSINWFRCSACNTLMIIEKGECAKYLFDDKTKETCRYCGRIADEETYLLQPEIITPTMFKAINSQLYQNLWNAAAFELSQATHVCFIGYSLPLADYELRYMLKKCIPSSARISVHLHKNDNPTEVAACNRYLVELLPHKRYTDMFPQNPIQITYNGFKDLSLT